MQSRVARWGVRWWCGVVRWGVVARGDAWGRAGTAQWRVVARGGILVLALVLVLGAGLRLELVVMLVLVSLVAWRSASATYQLGVY